MKLSLQRKYLVGTVVVLLALLIQACASTASSGVVERRVETHPSQGDIRIIEDATAQLNTPEYGIAAVLQTKELTPGYTYTMWVAIMNNPRRLCAAPRHST